MHETGRLRDSDTALDRDLTQVWTVRDGAGRPGRGTRGRVAHRVSGRPACTR
jgi:hypothetical protein